MWARHLEALLGLWLFFSWLIFGYPEELVFLRIKNMLFGTAIPLFSLSCYYPPFRYCHLLNVPISLFLIGWSAASGTGIDFAPHQNDLVAGLLLLMLSLVPSRSKLPPEPWMSFLSEKKGLDVK